MDRPIRVLLVDDHRVVRLGLRTLLESEPDIDVVGEAGNGVEAVAAAQALLPTVIVMDISMPEMDGRSGSNPAHPRDLPGYAHPDPDRTRPGALPGSSAEGRRFRICAQVDGRHRAG